MGATQDVHSIPGKQGIPGSYTRKLSGSVKVDVYDMCAEAWKESRREVIELEKAVKDLKQEQVLTEHKKDFKDTYCSDIKVTQNQAKTTARGPQNNEASKASFEGAMEMIPMFLIVTLML